MLNNSKHDIILQKNTTIGRTHQIAGITPLQVQEQHAVVSTATDEAKIEKSMEAVYQILKLKRMKGRYWIR